MADKAYLRAMGIGAVAGLRTFTAPAATLGAGRELWSGLVIFLAAGEIVADKLPFTPSRLRPGPLGARFVSGGLCGATVAKRNDGSAVAGAALGALAALASAWLGYTIRHKLVESGVPDFVAAVGEDSVAILTALRVAALPDEA